MSIAIQHPARTFADLYERLGGVPLDRIRMQPPPGTASERDVLEIAERESRLCELVDGVLVEKPMGLEESILAIYIASMLSEFVRQRNLGHVTGEQGMMRIFPDLVRIPDVAYACWDRFPGRRLGHNPIPHLAPDLVVEVISRSNTPAEMSIKVGEYFSAGTRLVWLVDPVARSVTVRESSENSVVLHPPETLGGGLVLPGFTLSLASLFGELDRHG